ncbi:MAG: superinfection exclusion B family protein [Bacteroidetes bacterium]|nr:superinfection exclusion B family protein [Bacteroidota bacterium]
MNISKAKLGLRLSIILGLILLLFPSLFQWITDDTIHQIGDFLGYKVLLTLLLILILLLVYQYFMHRLVLLENVSYDSTATENVNQTSEAEQKKLRIKLLSNLAEDEKKTLRIFIDGNKKQIRATYGRVPVESLIANGVIFIAPQLSVGGTISYSISDWAWEILRDNPKYLE